MDDIPVPVDLDSNRFIPQLRAFIRKKGLSYSTEKTYIHWVLNYIRFHKKQHPNLMGVVELAVKKLSPIKICPHNHVGAS
jgi:hypothetical protein